MLPNISEVVVMRLLIRHGFSRDMADMLLEDFRRAIDFLQKHPSINPPSAADGNDLYPSSALPKEKLPAIAGSCRSQDPAQAAVLKGEDPGVRPARFCV